MDSAGGLRDCPRPDSLPSGGTGTLFPRQIGRELAVGVAAVGDGVLLRGCHFGERLLRAARLKPGVPPEALLAPRLDEHFAPALAAEDMSLLAVPVGDTALRLRRAIVEGIRDRRQALPSRCFQQPAHVRSGEIAELIKA